MKKLLIAAGVIALTCSAQVFAQEEVQPVAPQGCPITAIERKAPDMNCQKVRKPHFDMEKFKQDLNLTEKQIEKIKALREAEIEAEKPIFDKLRQNDEEARALRKELRELRMKNRNEFRAILTDKQLNKLEEIKAQRMKEFGKRHHKMKHGRPLPPPPYRNHCQCGCQKPLEKPAE